MKVNFNMIKLSLVLSLILLSSCGADQSEANREDKQNKKIKTQEKANFKSLAKCVKSKSGGKKPTADMIKQCS